MNNPPINFDELRKAANEIVKVIQQAAAKRVDNALSKQHPQPKVFYERRSA